MSNKDTKHRILKILNNHSSDYLSAMKNTTGYFRALEGVPPLIQSLPLRLFQDFCDGLINDKQALETLFELIKNTPD